MGSTLSGRKTTLTPQVIDVIAGCIATGMTVKDSMVASGNGERTYYHWLKIAEEEQSNRELGLAPDLSKDIYLQFLQAINEAQAKGQRALLQRMYRAAFGPVKTTTTKSEVDGKGKVIRTTVTETVTDGDPKYAAWILERRWKHLFSKHTVQHKINWQDNIKQLLEQGTLSKDDLAKEIGDELAEQLFDGDELKQLGDGNIESTPQNDGRRSMGDDESGTVSQEKASGTGREAETSSPTIIDVAHDVQE